MTAIFGTPLAAILLAVEDQRSGMAHTKTATIQHRMTGLTSSIQKTGASISRSRKVPPPIAVMRAKKQAPMNRDAGARLRALPKRQKRKCRPGSARQTDFRSAHSWHEFNPEPVLAIPGISFPPHAAFQKCFGLDDILAMRIRHLLEICVKSIVANTRHDLFKLTDHPGLAAIEEC